MIVSQPLGAIDAWAERLLGFTLKGPHTALASVNEAGEFTAALIFQCRTDHDIEITVAAASIPRSLLRAAFRYAVGQLGCSRVTFRTRADHPNAPEALWRLGAKLEGRQRRFYGDCDSLIFGILKEDFPDGFKPKPAPRP